MRNNTVKSNKVWTKKELRNRKRRLRRKNAIRSSLSFILLFITGAVLTAAAFLLLDRASIEATAIAAVISCLVLLRIFY